MKIVIKLCLLYLCLAICRSEKNNAKKRKMEKLMKKEELASAEKNRKINEDPPVNK